MRKRAHLLDERSRLGYNPTVGFRANHMFGSERDQITTNGTLATAACTSFSSIMKIPVSPRTLALRKVSQGQILSVAERESLIASDLFLLASQSKLALTEADVDRLKPEQLFELAANGRITLRASDLDRLTTEQRQQLQNQ